MIAAAHDEEGVIAAKVANALALDWPRERLEVIVACDGCSDATAARHARRAPTSSSSSTAAARSARRTPACGRARGEILAFSDANALLERDAAAQLAAAFADPRVGYACGQVLFLQAGRPAPGADNQEGLYWRYEMAVRALESRLRSVTAGNGAI